MFKPLCLTLKRKALLSLFIIFLFSFVIHANSEDTPSLYPTKIESKTLYVSNSGISMEGDISFESAMGHLLAQKVRFFSKQDASFLPSFHAKNQVSAKMHTGAELYCDETIFHGNFLRGICLSKGDSSRVIYTDPNISDLPFKISCKKSTLFCKEDENKNFSIDHIKAWRDISILYDKELSAKCDKALIHPRTQDNESHLLLLKVPHEKNRCELSMINGDYLDAQMISITPDNLFCTLPNGKLYLKSSKSPFHLKGKKIIWKRKIDEISCLGPVLLWHRDLGKLSSQDKIIINRSPASKFKNGIETIVAKGKSLYVYPQGPHGMMSQLTCQHEIHFDQSKRMVHLKSESDDEPVIYEDALRTIKAKTVILDFDYENNAFTPKNLFLRGNVSIEMHGVQDRLTPSTYKQYAFCDQIDYNIDTGSMLLSSSGSSPSVLYMDELNKTTMSASSLLIQYDSDAKELVSAQGFGKVSFTLSDSEKGIIKKHFPTL